MSLFLKSQITKINFLSILIALFPISFIAGNMIINLNILLLILSCLIIYKSTVFNINYFLLDKIIILFFLFILITGIYNDYKLYINYNEVYTYRGSYGTTIKSLFFLKYLFLYIILRFLVEKKNLNLNFFLVTCTLSSLFVCLDIIFQYLNGKDLFGFIVPPESRRFSGPFGDELIAGGFIQRFSIFAFFSIHLFFSNLRQNLVKILIPILFLIFILGIVLSGNRMPLLIFLFTIILILSFNKSVRKFIIPFFILFSIVFLIIFKTNGQMKYHFLGFYDKINKIVVAVVKMEFNNKNNPQHLKEFMTFYDTWLMNKHLGGGIKNFRLYCHERPNIDKDANFVCNMHPHNYYLEIMTETGLVGFTLILAIFIIVIYLSFFKKYFIKSHLNNNNLIVPYMFLFFAEIFPLKSTGSFFTTGNATYLFLILGLLIALIRKHNSFENNL